MTLACIPRNVYVSRTEEYNAALFLPHHMRETLGASSQRHSVRTTPISQMSSMQWQCFTLESSGLVTLVHALLVCEFLEGQPANVVTAMV